MIRMALGAGVLLSIALSAQSTQAPSFEVASVRPAAPSTQAGGRASTSGDRVSYINTTLANLLYRAYQVMFYQIDGPSWIRTERYDVIAKAPDNTPKDQIPLMLQALLADRFKLKVHRETRELQIYALIFLKDDPKLEKVEGDAIGGVDLAADGRRRFLRTSMEQLVLYLTSMSGRPVLDKTNLAGAYNFPFELSMEEVGGINASANATPRPSIFTSLQEIGLKLESRKAPIEMIVVDGGAKTPTEN
jgi:uncharacterized protein (TIGR03435 family)